MISITINANSPEELPKIIKELAAAMAPSKQTAKAEKTEPAAPAAKNETPEKKEEKIEDAGGAAEKNETVNAEEQPPAPEPEKEITLEEVRAKLAALSQSGKQVQVKALIAKFGAAKLTDIAKEKYAELMKEAEGI